MRFYIKLGCITSRIKYKRSQPKKNRKSNNGSYNSKLMCKRSKIIKERTSGSCARYNVTNENYLVTSKAWVKRRPEEWSQLHVMMTTVTQMCIQRRFLAWNKREVNRIRDLQELGAQWVCRSGQNINILFVKCGYGILLIINCIQQMHCILVLSTLFEELDCNWYIY